MTCATLTCRAVGITPFDDWPRLMSSFACRTGPPAPASCTARLTITSLAFVLVDVAEPVWNTSTGRCIACCPSAISRATCWMSRFFSGGSFLNSSFARAAASLNRPSPV